MSLLSAIVGAIARWVAGLLRLLWNTLSIVVVLSVAATVPVLQFASLGYMLECSGRIASGAPIRECFPGVALAGHMVRCSLWTVLTWLPIWLITDLGYSSELIQPGSSSAMWLRVVARVLSVLWVLWIVWAIARGGSWKHFLWPRPIRFIKTVTSKNFWLDVQDRWWEFLKCLHLWRLIKLGFQASLGAWIWLAIPALMIWVSLNAAPEVQPQQHGGLALLGLLGAILMARAIQYLPTLQTHMALQAHRQRSIQASSSLYPGSLYPGSLYQGRLDGALNRKIARGVFRRVPLTYALTNILFLALALPLYVLRIESIPAQLWFLLSILFVVWMFPAKLLIGWLIRRAGQQTADASWPWRWFAWIFHMAAIGVYVGFLYLGKFALWEGGAILLFQHAFLPPVPFYVR